MLEGTISTKNGGKWLLETSWSVSRSVVPLVMIVFTYTSSHALSCTRHKTCATGFSNGSENIRLYRKHSVQSELA